MLKFGKGIEDAESKDFQQDVETHSNQKNSVYFDEILKYIMTNLANDEDSFANSEAFEKKIDNLVFQYIHEAFNIKSRISKEIIMTLLKFGKGM